MYSVYSYVRVQSSTWCTREASDEQPEHKYPVFNSKSNTDHDLAGRAATPMCRPLPAPPRPAAPARAPPTARSNPTPQFNNCTLLSLAKRKAKIKFAAQLCRAIRYTQAIALNIRYSKGYLNNITIYLMLHKGYANLATCNTALLGKIAYVLCCWPKATGALLVCSAQARYHCFTCNIHVHTPSTPPDMYERSLIPHLNQLRDDSDITII